MTDAMTSSKEATMPPRHKPTAAEMAFLLSFHAALSGAFIVAYLTGDEDTYGMHVAAGYTALVALTLRAVAGIFAKDGSVLRFPRPLLGATLGWFTRLLSGDANARRERSPLPPWMALALLIGVGAAAATGAVADFLPSVEDLHEALGEASLFIVFAHIALVLALHVLKEPGRAASSLRSLVERFHTARREARHP
jgi:cytochrome b561